MYIPHFLYTYSNAVYIISVMCKGEIGHQVLNNRSLDIAFPSTFRRDFHFRSKCGEISLLTDVVDLLSLIMKENIQIYRRSRLN